MLTFPVCTLCAIQNARVKLKAEIYAPMFVNVFLGILTKMIMFHYVLDIL